MPFYEVTLTIPTIEADAPEAAVEAIVQGLHRHDLPIEELTFGVEDLRSRASVYVNLGEGRRTKAVVEAEPE